VYWGWGDTSTCSRTERARKKRVLWLIGGAPGGCRGGLISKKRHTKQESMWSSNDTKTNPPTQEDNGPLKGIGYNTNKGGGNDREWGRGAWDCGRGEDE